MKIRTDFVTNSSDSSFLVFHIENKNLFDYLNSIGIKITKTKTGVLSDKMIITLPSGAKCDIDGYNIYQYPFASDYPSVTAWLFGLLLWEFEGCNTKEAEEYLDFTKELFELLHDADLLHADWDSVEEISGDDIAVELSALNSYDMSMRSAEIKQAYGFEGDIEHAEITSVRDGKMEQKSFRFSPLDALENLEDEDEESWDSIADEGEELGAKLWDAIVCGDDDQLFDLAQKANLLQGKTKIWNNDKWEDETE